MKSRNPLFPLVALVKTSKGEGFIVGVTHNEPILYDIRLFDGTIETRISDVTLIDIRPIDHPELPRSFREYLENFEGKHAVRQSTR